MEKMAALADFRMGVGLIRVTTIEQLRVTFLAATFNLLDTRICLTNCGRKIPG